MLGHTGVKRSDMLAHLRREQVRQTYIMQSNQNGFLSTMIDKVFIKSNQRKIRLLPFDVVLACTDISEHLGTLTLYCKEVD